MTNFRHALYYTIMQTKFHYRETPWRGREAVEIIKELIESTDIPDHILHQQLQEFCEILPINLSYFKHNLQNILMIYNHSVFGTDVSSIPIADIDSVSLNNYKGKVVSIGYNMDTHLHVIRIQQQKNNLFSKAIVPDHTIYIYDKLHKFASCIPLQHKIKSNDLLLDTRITITEHSSLATNTRNKLIQLMESKEFPKILSIIEPDAFCPEGEIILQVSNNRLETIDLQGNTIFLGEPDNFYHDEKVIFSLNTEIHTEEKYIPIRIWHKPWQDLLSRNQEEFPSIRTEQPRINFQNLQISTEKSKQKIIIALHGLFDHKAAYHELAKTLLADSEPSEALLVIAADWPTYGASLDRDQPMPTFSTMKQYLMALLEHVAITYPSSECYLLGESLGAAMIFICSSEIKELQLKYSCIAGVCAISPAIHNPETNLYLQQRFLGYSAEFSVFRSIWFNDPEVNHQNAISRVQATIPYLSEAYICAQHWSKEIPCAVFVTSHDSVISNSDVLSLYQAFKGHEMVFYAFPSRHLLLKSRSEAGKYIDRYSIFHDIGKIFSIMSQGKFDHTIILPISGAISSTTMDWYSKVNKKHWNSICCENIKGYLSDWTSSYSSMLGRDDHIMAQSSFVKPKTEESLTSISLLGIFPDGIQALDFIEHPIIGDGDCGFHALGITRQQLVSVLLPLATDNNARKDIAPEIRYALLSDDIPDKIKPHEWINLKDNYQTSWDILEYKMAELKANIDESYPSEFGLAERFEWLKEKTSNIEEQEALTAAFTIFNKNSLNIDELCKAPETFITYVNLYIIPKTLWLGYQTALIWAQASKTSLTIWSHTTSVDNTLSLMHSYEAPEELNIIHILHTSGFTHFNLLEQTKTRNLEREKDQILEWNSGVGDWSLDYTLYELFVAQVERNPEAIATISSDKVLTYSETLKHSNQVAHLLKANAVEPNQLVGVLMHKGWEQTIACIGILGSGAAFLPIDADWPEARIKQIIIQGKLSIVLTQQKVLIELSQSNILSEIQVVAIDNQAVWEDFPTTTLTRQQQPSDIAYVIFTSGSTGKPKGVIISHQNAINTIFDINGRFNVNEYDKILALSNLSFDLAIYDFFGIWTAGATVVLPDGDKLKDPSHWFNLLTTHKVTIWNTVPMFMQMMVEHLDHLPKNSYSALENTLRLTLLSGDWIPLELPNHIKPYFPSNKLISLGGATEGSIWSIIYPVEELNPYWKSIPYGAPMRNQHMYVLSDDLLHCPMGVAGEIHIGGQGVALGYWGDVERTIISFIKHPKTGEKLYKTGDLGKWSENGYIEFIGRKDTQVKVSGHRIELGEIESVLMQHSSIKQCAVLTYEREKQKKLVAYIVPKTKETLTHEIAKDHENGWHKVYEEIYETNSDIEDLSLNIVGWKSSYTGQPIPKSEMEEWVEQTTNRILTLNPKRVLEIGCGTGLLVARIAPCCEEYFATDISFNAINLVQTLIKNRKLDHVKTIQRSADDFSGWENLKVDTIIINSVIQCFSSAEYLLNVINHASQLLSPSGRLFIGDVRHLALLEAYHASVQLHKAISPLSRNEFLQKVQIHTAREEELLVDPTFFHALKYHIPNIQHSQILLKTGKHSNELNKFRYDVILFISIEPIMLIKPILQEYNVNDDLIALGSQLHEWKMAAEEESLQAIGIKSIPNARLSNEDMLLQWIRSEDNLGIGSTDDLQSYDLVGVDPYSIIQLGESLGLRVELRWHYKAPTKLFDAFFIIQSPALSSYPAIACEDPCCEIVDWQDYVNNPLLAKLKRELAPELTKYLAAKLPHYMIPTTFIFISHIPLSSNGKVDRQSLPVPDYEIHSKSGEVDKTLTVTEKILLKLFVEALENRAISISDSFFELGGNSLLAVQLIASINKHFQTNYPISLLFTHHTVKGLAKIIQTQEQDLNYKPLLSFNLEGKQTAIFFVHSGRGGAEAYVNLVHNFDLDQPIHVIESYNLYNDPPFLDSIEAMAKHYLQIVKSIQPQGPYYLGGWSLGGLVAYEMAQMIKKQGDVTNAIYFLDTFFYTYLERNLFSSGVDNVVLNDPFYQQLPQSYCERTRIVDRIQVFAMANYKPIPYNGDVILLKARDKWTFFDIPEFHLGWLVKRIMHHTSSKKHNGWSKLIPNLRVHLVPGHHQSIMEGDNAYKMARIIQDDVLLRQRTSIIQEDQKDILNHEGIHSSDIVEIRYITKVLYKNPILNHPKLLNLVIKEGGSLAVNRLIEIGQDEELAESIIVAIEEYGVKYVLNFIFGNAKGDIRDSQYPKITDESKQISNSNEHSDGFSSYYSDNLMISSLIIKEGIEALSTIKYFFKEILHIPAPFPEFMDNNYLKIAVHYTACNIGIYSIIGRFDFITTLFPTTIYGGKLLTYEYLFQQKQLDLLNSNDKSIDSPKEFIEKCTFDMAAQALLGLVGSSLTGTLAFYDLTISATMGGMQCYDTYNQAEKTVHTPSTTEITIPYIFDLLALYISTKNMHFDLTNQGGQIISIKRGITVISSVVMTDYIVKLTLRSGCEATIDYMYSIYNDLNEVVLDTIGELSNYFTQEINWQ